MQDETEKPQTEKSTIRRLHETSEVILKPFYWTLPILIIFGVVTHFGLLWMHREMIDVYQRNESWTISSLIEKKFNEQNSFPKLQLSPPRDMEEFRKKEDEALKNYAWVDRTKGIVRIPVERAMELTLQRGLPARSNNAPIKLGPSPLQLQHERSMEGGVR
jgi:hypothetical protein